METIITATVSLTADEHKRLLELLEGHRFYSSSSMLNMTLDKVIDQLKPTNTNVKTLKMS